MEEERQREKSMRNIPNDDETLKKGNEERKFKFAFFGC
jgi:hypothetical protein